MAQEQKEQEKQIEKISNKFLEVTIEHSSIIVKTKRYSDTIVSILKSIEPRGRWDPVRERWVFPLDAKEDLMKKLSALDLKPAGTAIVGGIEVNKYFEGTGRYTVYEMPAMFDLPDLEREVKNMHGYRLSIYDNTVYFYIPRGYEKLFHESFERVVKKVETDRKIVVIGIYESINAEIAGYKLVDFGRDYFRFNAHPAYERILAIRYGDTGSRRHPFFYGILVLSTRLTHLVEGDDVIVLPDNPEIRKKIFDLAEEVLGRRLTTGDMKYIDIGSEERNRFISAIKELANKAVEITQADEEIKMLEQEIETLRKQIEELEKQMREKQEKLEELRRKYQAS